MSARKTAEAGGLRFQLFEKAMVVQGVSKPFFKAGVDFPEEWFVLAQQIAEQAYEKGVSYQKKRASKALRELLNG